MIVTIWREHFSIWSVIVTIWREHFSVWTVQGVDFEGENGILAVEGGIGEWAIAILEESGRVGGMTDDISPPSATAVPETDRAVKAFAALGDRGRWAVARVLAKEPMLSATEVGERTGLPLWTASRQLIALWRAGLTERYAPKDDGRARVYRLTAVGAGLVQAGVLLEG